MKKLLLLLLITTIGYSQSATIHGYVSSQLTTGAEFITPVRNTESFYLGGGFSGAWDVVTVTPGKITEYDLKQNITAKDDEQWCSLYMTASFGFFKSIQVKYRGGLAVYNQKITFNNDYTKCGDIQYKPLIGVSFMYTITEYIGIEAGFDTFNKGTIGLTGFF